MACLMPQEREKKDKEMQEIWARWRDLERDLERERKDEEVQEIWARWRELDGNSDEDADNPVFVEAVEEEWVEV